jgi:MFS family permease
VSDPAPLVRWRDLWADRRVRPYVAGRLVSMAGAAVSVVTLPLLVFRESGSAAQTAAVAAAEALPYLLLGLLVGALADRVDRRALMVRAEVLGALALSTIPVARAFDVLTSWHVIAVALIAGVLWVWFDSAAWGVLPALVGRDRLTAANGLLWSASVLCSVVVPGVVGAGAAVVDPAWLCGITATTFLLSAACLRRLPDDVRRAPRASQSTRLRVDIAEGLRFIWAERTIRLLTGMGFCLSFCGGAVTGLLVVLAAQQWEVPAQDGRVGLLFTAGAVGALLASLALQRSVHRFGVGPVSIASFTLAVLGVGGLLVSAGFVAAVVALVVWEFASTLAIVNAITVRQQLTPDELQSRVNTTGRMIAWGGSPLGALVAGGIAEVTDARTAVAACAVLLVLATAVAWASPLRSLRSAVLSPAAR